MGGNGPFSTEHLRGDLRRTSVRGGLWTVMGQAAMLAIKIGATAVLARVLVPDDFGLVAIATSLAAVAMIFNDVGLGAATVQRETVTHEQASAIWWVNAGVSFTAALLLAALSPIAARIYEDPRVGWITAVIASSILFRGLGAIHMAILQRQMRFSLLIKLQTASFLLVHIGAIVAAVLGAGYWALALILPAQSVLLLAGYTTACPWMPGPPRRAEGAGEMLRFGAAITGAKLLDTVSRSSDKLLLGKYAGTGPTGIYTKAYELLLLPIRQINGPLTMVVVPALSRLQTSAPAYRSAFKRSLATLVALGMPVVVMLSISADEIIAIALGDGWGQAATVFQLLAPAAFFQTFNAATGWVFVSMGRSDRQLKLMVPNAIVNILAFIVGLPYGIEGVAIAYSISVVVRRPLNMWYCFHGTPVRLRDAFQAIWRTATASSLAGAIAYFALTHVDIALAPLGPLLARSMTFAVLHLAIWASLPGGRKEIGAIIDIMRDLIAKRNPSPEPNEPPAE